MAPMRQPFHQIVACPLAVMAKPVLFGADMQRLHIS
jgi:hypothetical protein